MKFIIKLNQLHEAIKLLRSGNCGSLSDESELEIELVKDTDPESICDIMSITGCTDIDPASYDEYDTKTSRKTTIEIFPSSENRPSHVTVMHTRELVLRKK